MIALERPGSLNREELLVLVAELQHQMTELQRQVAELTASNAALRGGFLNSGRGMGGIDLSVLTLGMFYKRIDDPQALRYWRLVITPPEERLKQGKRIPRSWTVSADMGRAIAVDEVSVDPETGLICFFERGLMVEPLSVRIEVSYERQESKEKGNKILAQAPLMPDQLWTHPVRIVERFDHLFAIDTNTKNGVSVTGVVYGRAFKVQIPGKTVVTEPNLTVCLEFRGMQDKAENIAWVQVTRALRRDPTYRPHFQIGLIVDSDLGNLERYNNRELPVYGDFYLPMNMKFIYASSKPAQETYTSTMIALADKEARRLLDYIIRERCNDGLMQVSNEPITHFKQWDPSILPARTN